MNYLGHAFLSFGNTDILTGNMIGDHVKGRIALEHFPDGIRKGIELHRKIDDHTDHHPATQRSKLLFREDYGLYAGAIMDTLYDHFLANDPKHFKNEQALKEFTEQTYQQLETNAAYFPETFTNYFQHMRMHNWLYGYRTMQGILRALKGVNHRATHMPPADKAYEIFVVHYYQLAQSYYELIDDVINFVKIELNQ